MLQRGKPQSSWALLQRLLRSYVYAHKRAFITAMILMSIAALMRGLFAHSLQMIVDGMDQRKGLYYMECVAAFVIGIFIIRGVTTYLHTVIMNKLGQRIVANIQQDMYSHVLDSDLAFFHANASGTLVSRIVNDVAVMRSTVSEVLLNSFRGGLEFISLVSVMFYQDWRLSIIVFIIFPVSAVYVSRMSKRLRRISSNTQAATGDFSALLVQTLQGIRHVKAYGNEAKEKSRVHAVTELIYKLTFKSVQLSAFTGPVMEILSSFAAAFLIVFGYWQVEHQMNTPGDLVAFIGSFILAYEPMKRMGRVNGQMQNGLAAAERVFTLMDVKPTIVDAPAAKSARRYRLYRHD